VCLIILYSACNGVNRPKVLCSVNFRSFWCRLIIIIEKQNNIDNVWGISMGLLNIGHWTIGRRTIVHMDKIIRRRTCAKVYSALPGRFFAVAYLN